jgi:hypothetical protein
MPCLTNFDYPDQRHHLTLVWGFQSWVIWKLEGREQRDLHAFFLMSSELTDDEAFTHRRKVSWHDPSLPQRAGRAYTHFEVALARDREQRAKAREPQFRS